MTEINQCTIPGRFLCESEDLVPFLQEAWFETRQDTVTGVVGLCCFL